MTMTLDFAKATEEDTGETITIVKTILQVGSFMP